MSKATKYMQFADDYMKRHADEIVSVKCWVVDPTRYMQVVELPRSVVVECTHTDEDGITLTETMYSHDRVNFVLTGRCRTGDNHHYMKSYPRDSQFPLWGRVRFKDALS